jgi:hypothetical protein
LRYIACGIFDSYSTTSGQRCRRGSTVVTRNRETMFLYRGLLGVDTERKINIVYKANKNKQLDSIDGRMSNNF